MNQALQTKTVARIIYLNGEDTGLKAYTKNQAVEAMAKVLRRRGHFGCTPERLAKTYASEKGRVDFTWPVQA